MNIWPLIEAVFGFMASIIWIKKLVLYCSSRRMCEANFACWFSCYPWLNMVLLLMNLHNASGTNFCCCIWWSGIRYLPSCKITVWPHSVFCIVIFPPGEGNINPILKMRISELWPGWELRLWYLWKVETGLLNNKVLGACWKSHYHWVPCL